VISNFDEELPQSLFNKRGKINETGKAQIPLFAKEGLGELGGKKWVEDYEYWPI
jgi:hypothetical protein